VDYIWDFSVVFLNSNAFLVGAVTTLKLSFFIIIFGTGLGVIFALGMTQGNKTLSFIITAIIEVIRSIPVLVLLIWIYYCLPIIVDFKFSAFNTAIVALSINMSVFAAEIFRSGIESIPKGFVEAGRCLGLSKNKTFWLITIPQASRDMLPAMVGLNITMLKFTSLASVISVQELLHAGNDVIAQSFRPLEVYTSIAIFYILLIMPFSIWSRRLEAKHFLARNKNGNK